MNKLFPIIDRSDRNFRIVNMLSLFFGIQSCSIVTNGSIYIILVVILNTILCIGVKFSCKVKDKESNDVTVYVYARGCCIGICTDFTVTFIMLKMAGLL